MSVHAAPLVGLAVGDALGMPFEKKKQSDSGLLWWDGLYQAGTFHNLKAGQWTDDTQMSIVLAEAILARPIYDQAFVAQEYAQWANDDHPVGAARGIGKATRTSLKRFRDLGRISPDPKSLGTGPVMRCSPIVMAYPWEQACKILPIDASITHGSPMVRNPLVLFGSCLATLLDGQEIPSALSLLAETVPGGEMQLIETAVTSALACLLRTDSFAAAVQMAIRLGGDTDTVGAMTGALAGAKYGLEGIPPQYLCELERVEKIRSLNDQLLKMGGRL